MFKVKVTFQGLAADSCLYDYLKTTEAKFMKKHTPCRTLIACSCVKVITDGQLPGVRDLRGHLLHIVTFLFLFFLEGWGGYNMHSS